MSAAPVLNSVRTVQFEVLGGPHQGLRLSLSQPLVRVGRNEDLDISLPKDSKVSRMHLEIHQGSMGLILKNVSQKNTVLVDGEPISTVEVMGPALVQLGDTQIKIQAVDPLPQVSEQTAKVQVFANVGLAQNSAPVTAAARPRSQSFRARPAKVNRMPQIIGGVLILAAGLWFAGEQSSKKKEVGIRGSEEIAKDLQASEKSIQELQKTLQESGKETAQYKSAQEHYVRGFRDYRQGQYARAIQSFTAALSFYPQHELARRYLSLSRKKFDELVKFNMNQGRKYLGKTNYRMCAASFAKVLFMLKDPNDSTYKEAKQYYDECTLRMQGRF